MNVPNRDKAVEKARFLCDMAREVRPADIRTGLAALSLVGVTDVLAEKYRIDNETVRARELRAQGEPPDGWCVWCTSAEAKRWVDVASDSWRRTLGVCGECYAELNGGN